MFIDDKKRHTGDLPPHFGIKISCLTFALKKIRQKIARILHSIKFIILKN